MLLSVIIESVSNVFVGISNRKNPIEFQVLRLGDVNSLSSSNYNPSLLTKIYAPGWNNEGPIAYPTRDGKLLLTASNNFNF